ncbi:MAG TPA: hypothetical protein VFW41_07780 [Gaiellaceae bacterium]|nr:hypothetical protein [Gaiellaceae bacterium]
MTYAVVWSENGGAPRVGRLELASSFLRLGGNPARELSYDDVADVRIDRRPTLRLAGRPTLVIESLAGDSFRVASFDGAGTLHELTERLETARRPA